MTGWVDTPPPTELGQRRSDHCTCLTEGGRRPHFIWLTHVNTHTRVPVPKLYTSAKPGDKASSSSSAIWPRLNALQCSAACRLENPGKCSAFLQRESLKKREERVCTLLSQGSYFMNPTRSTGQRRVKRPLRTCLRRGRIFGADSKSGYLSTRVSSYAPRIKTWDGNEILAIL